MRRREQENVMPDTKLTSHLTPQTSSGLRHQIMGSVSGRSRAARRTRSKPSSPMCACSPRFCPPDTTLGMVTTKELNRYFEWMEKERAVPCSPKTLARRITATKSLFRWLHQYGVLIVDPAEKVAQRSAISPLPTVLTPMSMTRSFWRQTVTAANESRTRVLMHSSISC